MALVRLYVLSLAILLIAINVSAQDANECSCGDTKLSLRTKAGLKAATAGLIGAVGTTSTLGSSLVGFTAAGIAKGSLAAYIQAKIGIFAGFSFFQSLGATGAFASVFGPVGLGIAATIGAATYYYTASGASTAQECNCDAEELTEEELTQFFALKTIELCVEPGTSKSRVCSGRGTCEFNKDNEELFCGCQPGFSGTYCEVFKNNTDSPSSQTEIPFHPTRCKDKFIQNCTICLIQKFTLNYPKNCYDRCNWKIHESTVANDDDIRPDVGELDMRRVVKMSVYEGTACPLQVNASCATTIKYKYEHTEDYKDQLVVYYSSEEAVCDMTLDFDSTQLILVAAWLGCLVGWLVWKIAIKTYSLSIGTINFEKD